MREIKDTSLGPIVSGTREELSLYEKLEVITNTLNDAGITHIDIVHDEETDKVRYYKRSMALEFNLNENLMTVAHRLGWHKFE